MCSQYDVVALGTEPRHLTSEFKLSASMLYEGAYFPNLSRLLNVVMLDK